MKALIVGYDHAFGKDRAGNFENLTRLSQELGFYVEKVEPFELNGERVGSRFIRDLIREGKVDRAAVFLGRLYHLSGTVVKGVARGRTLHFPTANLKLDYENKLLPENGVYAVDVRHDGKIYKGMLNIGFKPTFETGHAFTIEVHILNFDKEIYNEQLTVFFKKRLRSEKRFASKEALMAQLKIDKQQSLKL
jgi:riboflavin kinase/FMN adenylyltransferase